MSFEPLDFYRIEDSLASEERIVRDTVREFVDKEFLPVVVKHVRQDGSFPMELVPKLAELGLFGANLHGYGCAGMNNVAYGLVMQELERGDSGLRSFASVQGGLCMYPIYGYGSDAQKERWLPADGRGPRDRLLRPDRAGLRLEPRRHADARGAQGRPLGPERHQALDHQRHRSRTSRSSGRKTDDEIQGFLVETRHARLRGARHEGQVLAARVGHERAVPVRRRACPRRTACPSVKGLKGPLGCLTQARYGIAWGAIGAAQACFSEALRYSQRADRVRPAARLAADPAAEARVHGHRDHQGAAARVCSSAA